MRRRPVQGTAGLPSGETTSHYWNCVGGVHLDLTWREPRYTELQSNVELEVTAMHAVDRIAG